MQSLAQRPTSYLFLINQHLARHKYLRLLGTISSRINPLLTLPNPLTGTLIYHSLRIDM